MKKYSIILIISTILGFVQCSDLNLNDISKNFPNLPSDFSNVNITVDDIKKVVKEKCYNVTGNDEDYDEIEKNVPILMECFTNIVNVSAIQNEIEVARPQGELDAVFNKYCKKRPEAMDCVKTFNSKLQPCLTKEEKENNDVFMRVIDSLLNFVCYKGGDQIALFIAEKGPECLQQSTEPITNCLNQTFANVAPKDGVDVNNFSNMVLPQLIIGPKECGEMEELERCVVEALEKCEEITPANIVESMFRFIKNETSCPIAKAQKSTSPNSSSNLVFTNLFILFSGILCFINRFFLK